MIGPKPKHNLTLTLKAQKGYVEKAYSGLYSFCSAIMTICTNQAPTNQKVPRGNSMLARKINLPIRYLERRARGRHELNPQTHLQLLTQSLTTSYSTSFQPRRDFSTKIWGLSTEAITRSHRTQSKRHMPHFKWYNL